MYIGSCLFKNFNKETLITGHLLDENTFIKAINGLNETIGVVLEYLQDAKVWLEI